MTAIYFTKWLLVEYNNAAIREKRNRWIEKEYIEKIDDEMKLLVTNHFFHNTINEIRVEILMDFDTRVFLDMSEERFDILPRAIEDEKGNFIFESDEEIRKRFPYKSREWTQTLVKKPYRRQDKFRKKVLEAYNNRCAICSINEPKILRAAHIVPVAKGGSDDIGNGICLCTNHEIAFDQGLIKISAKGRIEVKSQNINITNSKINYPDKIEDYPSEKYLEIQYNKSYN